MSHLDGAAGLVFFLSLTECTISHELSLSEMPPQPSLPHPAHGQTVSRPESGLSEKTGCLLQRQRQHCHHGRDLVTNPAWPMPGSDPPGAPLCVQYTAPTPNLIKK